MVPPDQLSAGKYIKQQLLRRRWSRWVQEFKPDVIYVNAVPALGIAQVLPLPKAPLVLHLHEMGVVLAAYAEKYPDLLLRHPNRYIVVSEAARQSLLEYEALHDRPVTLVHACIPDKDFTDLPDLTNSKERNVFVVGGAGLVGWRKGTDLWLLMAVELRKLMGDRVRFIWVGTTQTLDCRVFQEKASLLGLDPVLEYVPVTPHPLPHYQQFDVFAMTSWEDPCPIVVLETMMLQKPVVCFAQGGGAPEEVGETGLVVEEFSPRQMAEAIAALFQSPERRAVLGKAARERVLANFTVTAQAPKIYRVIEEAVQSRGRSGT